VVEVKTLSRRAVHNNNVCTTSYGILTAELNPSNLRGWYVFSFPRLSCSAERPLSSSRKMRWPEASRGERLNPVGFKF